MTTNLSAPFKLILFGEHSVTKGEKCLAIAINVFGFITVTKSKNPAITIIDAKNTKIDLTYLLKESINDEIVIKLQKSIGCGLGTSASVSVLLAKYFNKNQSSLSNDFRHLLDEKLKITCTTENHDSEGNCESTSRLSATSKVLNTALELENIFHGKSSGVDVAASFARGLILYQNYSYQNLNTKYLQKYKILIFDSKIKKNTKEIIKNISRISEVRQQNVNKKDKNVTLKTNEPSFVSKENNIDVYKRMGAIAEEAYELLKGDFALSSLYILIRKNHDALQELGVVPEEMQCEVLRLREMGIESKITGAGCGGHLFTVVYKDFEIPNWEEICIVD